MASRTTAPAFAAWERSIASRYLRTKRKNGGVAVISLIAFVATMIAVAVLIIVMSIMNGFRTELQSRMLGFNGHVYVNGPAVQQVGGRDILMSRLKAVPGVVTVTPVVEAQAIVQSPNLVTGAIVRGLTPADLDRTKIISGNIKQGSLRGFGQGEYGGDIVIVGSRLAESLGVQPGDSITLVSPSSGATVFGSTPRSKAYTVGGIFQAGMSEYDAAFMYMPLEQAQLFFGRDQGIDLVEINLTNPDDAAMLKPALQAAAGPGAIVTDWRDRNKSFFNALEVERTAMRLILMLIIAMAAVNIVSSMIMLVKNKGRDIAILRTMGASRGAILRIFFMAGASIGAFGTLLGLAAGWLFCTYIEQIQSVLEKITGVSLFSPDTYFLQHIPAQFEWSEAAIITAASLAMTFLATLPSAIRAARLDPVEALRYE